MDINIPHVKAALEAAFARYETALTTNDVATLNELFQPGPHTIRYGVGENLYGSDEVYAFRAARSPAGLGRTLSRTVVTTYGHDFGTASTLFHRASSATKVGRQMQSWVRFDGVWRIVAAHVSLMDAA